MTKIKSIIPSKLHPKIEKRLKDRADFYLSISGVSNELLGPSEKLEG